MKKFIGKITIFILLFKVFDILLASFFLWVRLPNLSLETDYGSLNRMYQGLINADIVALGSSKIYLSINPEVLQQTTGKTAWNLGMDGSKFEQHYFTLEEYLLHNTHPQAVIFEANLETLDPAFLRFKTGLFYPYRNYSSHTMKLFSPNWEGQIGYWIISSAIYKQEIPQTINNSGQILDRIANGDFFHKNPSFSDVTLKFDAGDYLLINGAQLKKGQVPGQLPMILPFDEPQRHFDFSDIDQRRESFEKLSQLAEEKGFVLVLLMSPYLAGEVEEGQRRLAVDFYTALSEKYPNTYFLDFSMAEPFAHDTTLWWNAGHLNISGANLLSDKLGEELNQILAGHYSSVSQLNINEIFK